MTIPKQLTLETDLVRLRPMRRDDYDTFLRLAQDPDTWAYFSLNLGDPNQLNKWFELADADLAADTRRAFTIELKETGQVAGSSSMGNISMHDLRLEIGWSWLGNEFKKTQVNRNAKFAMMKYAFETLNFERVEFKTDVLNARARRGLEKVGGVPEGILRSHMTMWNNRRRTSIYYSVLKNEWPDVKRTNFQDLA